MLPHLQLCKKLIHNDVSEALGSKRLNLRWIDVKLENKWRIEGISFKCQRTFKKKKKVRLLCMQEKQMKRKRGPVVPAQDPALIDCGIFEKSLKTSDSFLFKMYYYFYIILKIQLRV